MNTHTISFTSLYLYLQGDEIVSFESVSQPGSYIRHQGYRLKVHAEEYNELYKNDASFAVVTDILGGIFKIL